MFVQMEVIICKLYILKLFVTISASAMAIKFSRISKCDHLYSFLLNDSVSSDFVHFSNIHARM